jgi:hypothetical protein
MKQIVVAFAFVTAASAQDVGSWPCEKEDVRPNLQLDVRKRIFGQLNDATGAAFERSRIVLRKKSKKGLAQYRTVMTDENGQFDLGSVEPASYRFLAGPNRGWKQPKEVVCGESSKCEINLALEVNPTDEPFAQCPINDERFYWQLTADH